MNDTREDYALPCGRGVEMVWERLIEVDSGRADGHELDCPHCTAVRESLWSLQAAVDELSKDTSEPSVDLVGRIMSAVRAETRRRDMVSLPSNGPNEARISSQAIASVLRFAADTVAGVRARRCRIAAAASDDGTPAIDVELTIAVSHRNLASGAYDLVRDRVTSAVSARIGVRLARLDIVVADVFDA
ncbi:MAG: Asp23/Gls24 family envelope stress response protein [Kibdelosporangium sp.]